MDLPCFLAISSEPLVALSIIVVLLPLIALWIVQFARLMSLEDGQFPGRFDKILWVAGFILICPLTPIAFLVWSELRNDKSPRQVDV
jgi:hypothetical protein